MKKHNLLQNMLSQRIELTLFMLAITELESPIGDKIRAEVGNRLVGLMVQVPVTLKQHLKRYYDEE